MSETLSTITAPPSFAAALQSMLRDVRARWWCFGLGLLMVLRLLRQFERVAEQIDQMLASFAAGTLRQVAAQAGAPRGRTRNATSAIPARQNRAASPLRRRARRMTVGRDTIVRSVRGKAATTAPVGAEPVGAHRRTLPYPHTRAPYQRTQNASARAGPQPEKRLRAP